MYRECKKAAYENNWQGVAIRFALRQNPSLHPPVGLLCGHIFEIWQG